MQKQKRKNKNRKSKPPSALFHMIAWGMTSPTIVGIVIIMFFGLQQFYVENLFTRNFWMMLTDISIGIVAMLIPFFIFSMVGAGNMDSYKKFTLQNDNLITSRKPVFNQTYALRSTFLSVIILIISMPLWLVPVMIISVPFAMSLSIWILSFLGIITVIAVIVASVMTFGAWRYTKRLETWQAIYYPQMEYKHQATW